MLVIDTGERYLRQARWAAGQFGLEDAVEFRRMQVYAIRNLPQTFDIVLFLGVFYHLRYPLLALDVVAEKTRDIMVFQTLTMPGHETASVNADLEMDQRDRMREPGWPKMAFIEHRLQGDPTNWWAPNHAGVMALLRSAGFNMGEHEPEEFYVCRRRSASEPGFMQTQRPPLRLIEN